MQEIPHHCHWFLLKTVSTSTHQSSQVTIWSGQPVAAEYNDVRMPVDASYDEFICVLQSGVGLGAEAWEHVQLSQHSQTSPETIPSLPLLGFVLSWYVGLLGCPVCLFPWFRFRSALLSTIQSGNSSTFCLVFSKLFRVDSLLLLNAWKLLWIWGDKEDK